MNEFLKAQVTEHCQMVQRGCKPLSVLPCQDRHYSEAIEIISEHKLFYKQTGLAPGWNEIYIFKNKAIELILPDLPNKPIKPWEHAFLGLMFGYSIDSICDFINKSMVNETVNNNI